LRASYAFFVKIAKKLELCQTLKSAKNGKKPGFWPKNGQKKLKQENAFGKTRKNVRKVPPFFGKI